MLSPTLIRLVRLVPLCILLSFFLFNEPPTTETYTLSLHDALPICIETGQRPHRPRAHVDRADAVIAERERLDVGRERSEEHTSELQSPCNLVCRLLLEKKKNKKKKTKATS